MAALRGGFSLTLGYRRLWMVVDVVVSVGRGRRLCPDRRDV